MPEDISNNLDELVSEYVPYIEKKIAGYKLNGFGKDDLLQEGRIALLDAKNAYLPERGSSFKAFALKCINNRIISFVRGHLSLKNLPLTNFVSLENDGAAAGDDPEARVIEKEDAMAVHKKLSDCLSGNEKRVLSLYLSGNSIKEISVITHFNEKSVQNALYRIRQKLKQISK